MTPRSILLHPGFHKTGTSSIQHLLWTNRALLAPHVTVLLLRHLRPAAQICMSFARSRNPLVLADLAGAMDAILADHLPADPGDLILSCEGLSGHLPGWPGVADYAAAPVTAAFLTGYLAERFPGVPQAVVYGTRAAQDWLGSVWRHHLLGQRLRQDWPAFAAAHAGAADLDGQVAAIAAGLAPLPVHALPLEEAATHPLGPGGALLDLIALPAAVRAAIVPVPPANRGPDAATAARFLALNRSDLPDAAVQREKATLAESLGIGGWAGRGGPEGAPP
jgi:hypothetical protein